jgi:hypothetical protein
MSYVDTFIRVAEDCPVDAGIVPAARGERKSIAAIQHELLTDRPYRYTHEDLIFEVHIRHKAIPQDVLKAQGDAIRAELFRKNHPCMRASPLPKTHGWGVHFDGTGGWRSIPSDRRSTEGSAWTPLSRSSRLSAASAADGRSLSRR